MRFADQFSKVSTKLELWQDSRVSMQFPAVGLWLIKYYLLAAGTRLFIYVVRPKSRSWTRRRENFTGRLRFSYARRLCQITNNSRVSHVSTTARSAP